MGMFSKLMSKIFGSPAKVETAPTLDTSLPAAGAITPDADSPPPVIDSLGATTPPSAPTAVEPAPTPAPVAPPVEVDVTALLDDLAAKHDEKLDWKKSIVDLLKLVGMESSLSARKELADELHYTGDKSDSATMNVWLHKEVIKRIAQNGGKVPADLLD